MFRNPRLELLNAREMELENPVKAFNSEPKGTETDHKATITERSKWAISVITGQPSIISNCYSIVILFVFFSSSLSNA